MAREAVSRIVAALGSSEIIISLLSSLVTPRRLGILGIAAARIGLPQPSPYILQ